MNFGGYRSVWLLVMFDLPTDTKAARKAYQNFRMSLLDDGFDMLQYSVYGRHCATEENADVHEKRLLLWLPQSHELPNLFWRRFSNTKHNIFFVKAKTTCPILRTFSFANRYIAYSQPSWFIYIMNSRNKIVWEIT